MSMITFAQVDKRFKNGVKALEGLNLEIEQGSFTVIIGPSGAGKSTLLRVINGLERPTRGRVEVSGRPVNASNLTHIRGEVGMIFQNYNLVGRLSVMTNALTGALSRRSWLGSLFYLFRKSDMEAAYAALGRVGLVERAWHRADRLSGGQQQRVGIARTLVQEPSILLADEPVASLDPVTSEGIMRLLRDICERDGVTVIVNLHQIDIAKRFADRIIGLNAGKLVFDGSPLELEQRDLDLIYEGKKSDREKIFGPVLAYA